LTAGNNANCAIAIRCVGNTWQRWWFRWSHQGWDRPCSETRISVRHECSRSCVVRSANASSLVWLIYWEKQKPGRCEKCCSGVSEVTFHAIWVSQITKWEIVDHIWMEFSKQNLCLTSSQTQISAAPMLAKAIDLTHLLDRHWREMKCALHPMDLDRMNKFMVATFCQTVNFLAFTSRQLDSYRSVDFDQT
jgi:hypothetical protein